MGVLDNLEVINIGQRQAGYDPIRTRRRKLAAGLAEQLNLLTVVQAGEIYRRTRIQKRQDLETDEVVISRAQRSRSQV